MGGVLDLAPGVAGMFLVASFSLAGMPPFSGFVSKLVLVRAGLAGGAYLVVPLDHNQLLDALLDDENLELRILA